jgi:hypothetical protein
MLRTLTTIGLLVAIALPLWDYAMFRPGRRTLVGARTHAIERLIYFVFLIAVLLMALSSFGMILVGESMHGWMLILHMSVAGLFAVALTALALLWAEQASFTRDPATRFYTGEKVAFWLTVLAGFSTILSAMLGMMSWFGTVGQSVLLDIHRYSALTLLITAIFHGYRLLVGRPRGESSPGSAAPAADGTVPLATSSTTQA